MPDSRLTKLRAKLGSEGLAALALIPGPSLFYLSGVDFHLMERPIIAIFPADADPLLVCPEFERSKAESTGLPWRISTYGENPADQPAAAADAVSKLNLSLGAIAVEPLNMRYNELTLLQQAGDGLQFAPGDHIAGDLRLYKDQGEIDSMRQAVRIAERALENVLPEIRIGMSELEVARMLSAALLQEGSETRLPFEPIVASGPNSALPHATPTERKLKAGDLLMIDWGARHNGYCSDLTRTFSAGEPSADMMKLHSAVLAANAAGRAAVAPEHTAGSVDRTGREVIEANGLAEHFLHRIGHGLGLEAHEPPYLFAENERPLLPGMAFTIEPGAYREGYGGVRIEDNVVVTATGVESLSEISRDLRQIG